MPHTRKEHDRYVLKGTIPAQETLRAAETVNPPFELSYWHFAMQVAQTWRERTGMERVPEWDVLIEKLSPLAYNDEQLYLAAETAVDTYKDIRFTSDHMAVLGAVGILPMNQLIHAGYMKNTLHWIWDNWNWDKTWGWDYPMTAMNAARMGEPEKAVSALLMDKRTNTYLVNGHNYQDGRLRIYLPGNGGLLTTVAMMCAGWDGSEGNNPGFPKDGKWNVRWEGLQPLPYEQELAVIIMKTTYLLLCLLGIGSVSGAGQTKQPQKIGDFIESTSYNEHRRNATRSLQYTPDGDDFVCINGKNRFTRALYGSHTAFRLETSDRPVFAAYTKENPKHICFKLQTSGGTVALDSTEHCESRYTAGRCSYSLSDPAFGGGSLSITTWALPDKEGAIWQFNARNFKEFHPVLLASISEIRISKLNRNGDMGADPADSFEAPLQPQQLQSFPVQIDGTLYMLLENQELRTLTTAEGENLFKKAEAARSETASRIRIETPDPYFNTLGGTLAMAADESGTAKCGYTVP